MFHISKIDEKISMAHTCVEQALLDSFTCMVPALPERDVEVLSVTLHPTKKGLANAEGQARLLHDLTSIELQAMELAFRTLVEFPDAPYDFRKQLAELTLSESRHVQSCLQGLRALGFEWGHWPVHLALWNAVSKEDSILDRILIVHRYLEGSGLDAADMILKRLVGVTNKSLQKIVRIIMQEEIDHVQFGSKWYRELCRLEKLNSDEDFAERLHKLSHVLPRRLEEIQIPLRKQAGFSENELSCLIAIQKVQRT